MEDGCLSYERAVLARCRSIEHDLEGNLEMFAAIVFSVVMLWLAMAGLGLGDGAGPQAHEVTKYASGFQFTEGPAWHPDGYLVFSDIPADTIFAVRNGETEVFRKPSGNSNGLAFGAEGALFACEHGNRRVSMTRSGGEPVPLATHYDGKRLNSPNDLVVRSDGWVYFTDPPYGVRPEQRELDFQGVFRAKPGTEPELLTYDFVKPNGLAFSVDEKKLYVADTELDWIRVFDVGEEGGLVNGRVFHRFRGDGQFRPDGMKLDTAGNLYVAGRGGVRVIGPDGALVDTVCLPEIGSNVAFGGTDGKTVFVTARTSVYCFQAERSGAVVAGRHVKAP